MAERQLQIDIQYSEQLGMTRNDLPFHLEKMKAGKRGKLACNLNDKEHLKKCTYQKFKTRSKLWTETKKSSKSD